MTAVHNEQLPNFDFSPNFTIKLRRKGWVGPMACMKQKNANLEFRYDDLKERDSLEDMA